MTIDPNSAEELIKVGNLDRVVIGTKATHPTHDARIDDKNRDVLFWSTYVLDPAGKMHVGKSDLKTGNVVKDVTMTPDPKAFVTKPPGYCASGQSEKYYMPVFMGTEGYLDIYEKMTPRRAQRCTTQSRRRTTSTRS